MIHRFRKVMDGVFRGSAPTPHDLLRLKQDFGIKKIISLDEQAGEKISRACKMLGIKQEKIYINSSKISLLKLFKHNLGKLLLDGGPTFVHCYHGKDRTGLLIAIFKIKYMGMEPQKALEEAKSLGFGINVPLDWVKLYEKLILHTKPSKDLNNADSIVDQSREGTGDTRDSYLHHSNQSSNSAFLDKTKQYPMDLVYNSVNDQDPTRENYNINESIKEHSLKGNKIPQVGVYNNEAGVHGAGPIENAGKFL